MKTKEQDQVESPVEETKEEETVELSEDEQVEQVRNLLNPDSTETKEAEESEAETETQEETQEEVKPDIISDEIIEQFPTLKMYRGKPIKELAPSYDKLVRKLHETIQKNKELEGKLSKTSLNELGEPPDPIENRAEFDKWLEKRDKLIKSQVKVEPEPTINPLAEVKKRLPDADVEKIADEWAKFNSRRLFDATGNLKPEIKKMYQEDPDLMVDELISFYNLLSKAEQNELQIEKKAKEETFKQTKEAFKKARQTKKESSQVQTVQRNVTTTPEDQMLMNILKYAEEGQI